MKKIISFVCLLWVTLWLTSCGNSVNTTPPNNTTGQSPTQGQNSGQQTSWQAAPDTKTKAS